MVPGRLGCASVVFAAMTTLAPSRAALRPMASPIPRLAPVIKSVFPRKLGIHLAPFHFKLKTDYCRRITPPPYSQRLHSMRHGPVVSIEPPLAMLLTGEAPVTTTTAFSNVLLRYPAFLLNSTYSLPLSRSYMLIDFWVCADLQLQG